MTEHKYLGGDNPRVLTRGQLLDQRVPLACNASRKENAKRSWTGTYVQWFNEKDAARKRVTPHMDKQAYHAFRQQMRDEWRSMSGHDRARELHKARANYPRYDA
eukprot:445616-Karenia_brevis.AAC.1